MPLVVALVVIVVVYAVMVVRRSRECAAAIAELRVVGAPTSPAEVIGEPVPESENSAPLYAGILSRLPPGEEIEPLSRFLSGEQRDGDPGIWSQAREILARCSGLSPDIEAAVGRPHYWIGVEPTAQGVTLRSGQLAESLRPTVLLLAARGILRAADGDMDGAVADVIASLQASRVSVESRTLFSFLVRIALMKASLVAMYGLFEHGEPGRDHVKRLFHEVSHVDLAEEYARAIEGESAVVSACDLTGLRRLLLPFSLAATASNCRLIVRHIQGARLSYSEAEAAHLLEPRTHLPPLNLSSWRGNTAFARVNLVRYLAMSDTACAQAFLSVYTYRLAHAEWPRTLEEAELGTEGGIAKDPFNGGALVYERQDDSFRVSSVGREGTEPSCVGVRRNTSGVPRVGYRFGAVVEPSRSIPGLRDGLSP